MAEKKEISMEVRLLLAFVLMGLVLVGTQLFYKPPPPPPADKAAASKSSEPVKTPEEVQSEKPAPAVAAVVPGEIQAEKEETFEVETDLYRVTFSNHGAVVRSWILKAHKDNKGKPLDLVNQPALKK